MLTIQPWCFAGTDKELTTVRVWSSYTNTKISVDVSVWYNERTNRINIEKTYSSPLIMYPVHHVQYQNFHPRMDHCKYSSHLYHSLWWNHPNGIRSNREFLRKSQIHIAHSNLWENNTGTYSLTHKTGYNTVEFAVFVSISWLSRAQLLEIITCFRCRRTI